MKRFLYSAAVEKCGGSQTFFIDAETSVAADKRAAADESDGIYSHDVDVESLGSMEACGVTTTDDYGDYPLYDSRVLTDATKAALYDTLKTTPGLDVRYCGDILEAESIDQLLVRLMKEKHHA